MNYISNVSFIMNHAHKGGGVCLEMNSKLYIQKEENCLNPLNSTFVGTQTRSRSNRKCIKQEGARRQAIIHSVKIEILKINLNMDHTNLYSYLLVVA